MERVGLAEEAEIDASVPMAEEKEARWRKRQLGQLTKLVRERGGLSPLHRLKLELALAVDLRIVTQLTYELEGDGFLLPILNSYLAPLKDLMAIITARDVSRLPCVSYVLQHEGLVDLAPAQQYVFTACELMPLYHSAVLANDKYREIQWLADVAEILDPESPLMKVAVRHRLTDGQPANVVGRLEMMLANNPNPMLYTCFRSPCVYKHKLGSVFAAAPLNTPQVFRNNKSRTRR